MHYYPGISPGIPMSGYMQSPFPDFPPSPMMGYGQPGFMMQSPFPFPPFMNNSSYPGSVPPPPPGHYGPPHDMYGDFGSYYGPPMVSPMVNLFE